jgi:hypothetical protein
MLLAVRRWILAASDIDHLRAVREGYLPVTAPKIVIARKTGSDAFLKRALGLGKLAAYVGVPSQGTERKAQLLGMAGKTKSPKKRARLTKAATEDVTNAELLFIHTKGSPKMHIPARPVIEPAVAAEGNKQAIANELVQSARATIDGKHEQAVQRMKRAGLAGQNAARSWFTDSRNGWKPNAPSTIARKGSARPLIDTGALRASITYVIKEE